MDRCTGHHNVTEILLKMTLNTIQSINKRNSLQNNKILEWAKLTAFADDKITVAKIILIGQKTLWEKGDNAGHQDFLLFSQ